VLAGEVQGRVVFGVPMLGRFVRAARSDLGFILMLVVPAAFVIVHETRSIRRNLRKDRQDKVGLGGVDPGASPPRRQLILVAVTATGADRQEVLDQANRCGGAVVAVDQDSVVLSFVGEPAQVSEFERTLTPFGLCASERTGVLTAPAPRSESPTTDVVAPAEFDRIIAEGFDQPSVVRVSGEVVG
jgi:hypothetical protein